MALKFLWKIPAYCGNDNPALICSRSYMAIEINIGQKKPLIPFGFALLSVLIGVVSGLGAVVFRGLIALFHNILFLGKPSVFYDANVHTAPAPWGVFVILVPVIGAIGVAFLVKTFAPEAKGHGVPEVMDAIYYNRGRIRPIVAVIKSLASALSIGSGGSVGREGPIIQIGASLGSMAGQALRLPAWQRITLIAGGAGGGIAATFNTPIGGVLFVMALMMPEISVRTLVPVIIATTTATYIAQIFFGVHPSFVIPSLETIYFHLNSPLDLLTYAGLGIVSGIASALFVKSIYGFEDFFVKRVGGSYYRQHLSGMLVVGVIIYAMTAIYGHYYVEGVGYATVQDVLSGSNFPLYFLLLLFFLKLLVTSLTLGSGASGGIFSPSLFLGATLGSAYGIIIGRLVPQLGIDPSMFAVAGMAGIVGGATGAAMAAIVMIFEMTLDYNVILPMTIVVAISYGMRKVLLTENIYTMKLARRGHYVPKALLASPHLVTQAKNMMMTKFGILPASGTLNDLVRAVSEQPAVPIFLVEDANKVTGFLQEEAALIALNSRDKSAKFADIVKKDYITVSQDVTLFDVITRMHSKTALIALVTDGDTTPTIDKVKGIITKQEIADVMEEDAELFMA
jgi:CIC family chloride channel protein